MQKNELPKWVKWLVNPIFWITSFYLSINLTQKQIPIPIVLLIIVLLYFIVFYEIVAKILMLKQALHPIEK